MNWIDRLDLPTPMHAFLKRLCIFQLLRYGITGSLAAGTQYFIVILLVEALQLDPVYANIAGYICGFFVSLIGHRFWTFKRTTRPFRHFFPQFTLSAGLNFVLNQSSFYLLYRHVGVHYTTALWACIIIATSITFLINKFWVFRD